MAKADEAELNASAAKRIFQRHKSHGRPAEAWSFYDGAPYVNLFGEPFTMEDALQLAQRISCPHQKLALGDPNNKSCVVADRLCYRSKRRAEKALKENPGAVVGLMFDRGLRAATRCNAYSSTSVDNAAMFVYDSLTQDAVQSTDAKRWEKHCKTPKCIEPHCYNHFRVHGLSPPLRSSSTEHVLFLGDDDPAASPPAAAGSAADLRAKTPAPPAACESRASPELVGRVAVLPGAANDEEAEHESSERGSAAARPKRMAKQPELFKAGPASGKLPKHQAPALIPDRATPPVSAEAAAMSSSLESVVNGIGKATKKLVTIAKELVAVDVDDKREPYTVTQHGRVVPPSERKRQLKAVNGTGKRGAQARDGDKRRRVSPLSQSDVRQKRVSKLSEGSHS